MVLRTFVLGEFALSVDDGPPFIPHGVAAELLALLCLDSGHAVPTARLIEALWAPNPPPNAAARLHVHVSRTRRLLREIGCPDTLRTRNDGYALDVAPDQRDHVRFADDAAAGLNALNRHDYPQAGELLATALGRWRGSVLGGIGDREWAQADVDRLTALRRQATDGWAQARLALGDHTGVIAALDREVLEDPLRERTAGLLMSALYHDGRQADALNVYVRTRAALADALGVDPSPALHANYVAILRHEVDAPTACTDSLPVAHPLVDVPVRMSVLVGRDSELAALDEAFAENVDDLRVVVLAGLGGVGKSRLALEAAYRAVSAAPIVWWVPAVEPVAAAEALTKLARALGISELADQSIMLSRLWHELRGRRDWVLVYDDCPSPEALTQLGLPDGAGTVLITSRQRAWGGIGRVIPVEVLAVAESVRLLTSVAGDDDADAAADLATQMGGLPLALVQAGAYADQTGMSLAHYAGIFSRRRLALLSRAIPDDHQLGVATTWAMSLDQLATRSPPAAELLELCAALGQAAIPVELLRGAADTLDEPLRSVLGDELALEDTIAELLRFSVVSRNRDAIMLHPLLRAVLRERAPEPVRDAARRRADRVVTGLMPRHPEAADQWARCSWWVPHALDTAAAHAAAGRPERGTPLLLAAARYLTARARYSAARTAVEQALTMGTAAWGPADPRLVPLYSQLGLILDHLGDLESGRRSQEEALALLNGAGGRDSLEEATLLVRLGRALCCRRDLGAAVRAFERALDVLARFDAPHEQGRCLTDLALAIWMTGRPVEALALFDRALAILDAGVGARHPDAAHAWSGRAVVLQDLGHIEEAYSAQSDALAMLTDGVGERHPDVGHALDKLGYMAGLLGRWQESIARHQAAMVILGDIYGEDHVELAMPLTNIGMTHLAAGDTDAAATAQERARNLFAAGLGPRHPHTALATRRLGLVRQAQGRYLEAEDLLRAALIDTEAGLGAEHPDVAATERELAECLRTARLVACAFREPQR